MDKPTGEATFGSYVPAHALKKPDASLADLSGCRASSDGTKRTAMVQKVEEAWGTSLNALSCEQVRLLVGQKAGLDWLAVAVAHFVHDYPAVEIPYFPGDLTVAALRTFNQIAQIDRLAAQLLREADYSLMAECYTFSRDLAREAEQLVARARQQK